MKPDVTNNSCTGITGAVSATQARRAVPVTPKKPNGGGKPEFAKPPKTPT